MTRVPLFHSREYLIGFLIISVCILLRCSHQLAGGTSTTDNPKVVGTIIGDDTYPAPNTRVVLLPENSDPLRDTADIVADTTDDFGRYELPFTRQGVFNIQATNLAKRTRLLIRKIDVHDQTDTVAADTLQPPGSVKIALPPNANLENGYMYIPGTIVFAFLKNSSGFVTLDSVPAGKALEIAYSTTNSSVATILRYSVKVKSNDTAFVWNPGWNYSRKFTLNTSASGADVAGGVTDFPVLVRLTADNFDFTQAKNRGEDIRIAKPDNTFLAYEIERWDPIQKRAELWVKADTVRGGDSSQALIMYWGNGNASEGSNGAAVFDPASGFEGVWRLSETSGTRAADGSYNGLSGTFKGGLPKNVDGPLGICQNIERPDSDYVDMGNVLDPGLKSISVGVWIKRGSFVTPQAIVAKTNGDLPSASYGYLLSIDPANSPHFNIASGGANWGDEGTFDIMSKLAITDSTAWHYVFVVIDRSGSNNCRMYLDGVDRTGKKVGDITHVMSVSNALNFHIGTESDNNYSYKGAIAEATISFTARSADWIKLSFMNQKEHDALVRW